MRKKDIKRMAEADHQKILDQNAGFYQQLIAQHYPQQQTTAKPNGFGWKKLSVAMTTFVLLIVTITMLVIYLPQNKVNADEEKRYSHQDEYLEEVELSFIKQSVQSFDLDVDGFNLNIVGLAHDKITRDELYYFILGVREDLLEDFYLYIVINEDYDFPRFDEQFQKRVTINGYLVNYHVETQLIKGDELLEGDAVIEGAEVSEDDVYVFETNACIKFGAETVYVDYTCIKYGDSYNTFFDWLGKAITPK